MKHFFRMCCDDESVNYGFTSISEILFFSSSNDQNRSFQTYLSLSHEFMAHEVNNYGLTVQSFPHLNDFRCSS